MGNGSSRGLGRSAIPAVLPRPYQQKGRATMAKKRQANRVAGKAPVAAGPACRLREVPTTPDFEAATGAKVNLFVHDHVGAVLIAKGEYAGQQLVPPGQAVSKTAFTVGAGRNTLKLVFVFSASTTGQGELREDCGGDSHFLRALNGDEPFQMIRIIGK